MLNPFEAMEDFDLSDSLFRALRKYPKSQELDPIENFITEGFAWLLRNKAGVSHNFLNYLATRLPESLTLTHDLLPEWKTQHTFPGGQIDMLADFGQFAFIFEHKIWSSLSPGQLDKYREYASSNSKWSQGFSLVLITGLTRQHEQNPDLALTWSDIYNFLKYWLEKQSDDHLVRDFMYMLSEENLGPAAPVSYESIVSFLPAQSLLPNLKRVTLVAAEAKNWIWVSKRIGFNQEASIPCVPVKYQWGRLGIDILDSWFPGIFIGTLLDGSDHRVQLLNSHLGPNFCLILSFHIDMWKHFEGDFFNSIEYTELRSRLKNNSGKWDFCDHRFEAIKANPWHHLHLRQSLTEVLRGSMTFEEQVERFILQGREVIELLLAGGELEALTQRLHPIARNSHLPSISLSSLTSSTNIVDQHF
ncbi:PD-(D/E)XK nuclease family protein [Nostoc sp. XA010]|uniref:PD-(D/E)XK nuclease family protein n=1 Tax=Nostoc sp. XA010 TaxID=2780407 RepID=UPI001E634DB1|nr:PD-(D/E)XK nuclease family protein [Nostoc sp. XA010]MCC5659182.1 PD-(D/E)XK nuclease family protein [Nostoc sp. XA010]